MTTDGLPERPEFESQQTDRILRRISEAILVSADTTRKVEEGAAFAVRQDFIDSQVSPPAQADLASHGGDYSPIIAADQVDASGEGSPPDPPRIVSADSLPDSLPDDGEGLQFTRDVKQEFGSEPPSVQDNFFDVAPDVLEDVSPPVAPPPVPPTLSVDQSEDDPVPTPSESPALATDPPGDQPAPVTEAPFGGMPAFPSDHPFDPASRDPKPNESPEPAPDDSPDTPDPFAEPPPARGPIEDPFAGEPPLPSDHPFDMGVSDQKPDFSLIAESPPLPASIDPMLAQALKFQNSQDPEDDEAAEPDELQGPGPPPSPQAQQPPVPQDPSPPLEPQVQPPPAIAREFPDQDFTQYTFEGMESSTGRSRTSPSPFDIPVDMPRHPMQSGEQETLFHEDDSTILQMAQQYREADRQFRKGVMDIFELIIMDLHSDNARLMSIARHFQQSRRSTR